MAASFNELDLKLKEILKLNGITSPVSEIIYGDSGLKGENFSSETEYVTVKFEENGGKQPLPLNLFIKKETANPAQAEMLEDTKFFEKEIVFFTKYIPKAFEYCKSRGNEELLSIYPKCYYAEKSLLVFENLVADKGFTLLPKLEQQDFQSASFAMTTLGKHHGIAHAMINACGGKEKFLEEFPIFEFDSYWRKSMRDMIEPCQESGVDAILAVLEETGRQGSKEAMEKIGEVKGKAYNKLLEDLKPVTGSFQVFNHGDYWNNNMMFLKNEEGKVTGHVTVDLQQVKYNTPCVDLSYYLYSSVKPEVRRVKLHDLLKIYWDTFSRTSEDLGYPMKRVFSFEDLLREFSNKFEFGFWFGMVLMNELSYAIFKEIDVSQFKDMSEWGENHRKCTKEWIKKNPGKCVEIADNIISMLEEYEEVKKSVIM